jgi:hypothetical protein
MAPTRHLIVRSAEEPWLVEDEHSRNLPGSYRSDLEANATAADVVDQGHFDEAAVRRVPGTGCYRWTLSERARRHRLYSAIRGEADEDRASRSTL